ncbi:MAG: hypothetical protein V4641_13020 [Pseudomonadota bacterium]
METNHARNQAKAQAESIAEMVAALDCDYDRLEELRELEKTKRYVAGCNMPGYLPDGEPAEFDDADDALDYVKDMAKASIDDDTDLPADIAAQQTSDIDEFWRADSNGEFGQTFVNYHYWVTQDGNMLSPDEATELAELESAAGDCESQDDAQQRISEDPLSVEVRSDWHAPGDEDNTPSEFKILLCTGGPAVQIMGELDEHGTPCRAWLEYQDWGTPWTEYHGEGVEQDTLLTYCQQFFG